MAKATAYPPAQPPGGAAAAESSVPPPFGSARTAGGGSLPRVVDQLDRATDGTTRFKVYCKNYPEQTQPMYILAKTDEKEVADRDAAEKCYLEASGLNGVLARLKDAKVENIVQPQLVVTRLAD